MSCDEKLKLPPGSFDTPELKRKLAKELHAKHPGTLKLPKEAFQTREQRNGLADALRNERYARYPKLWEALEADTRAFLRGRGEEHEVQSRLSLLRQIARLSWSTDAFVGLALYRVRGRLLARNVPVLPQVLHRACMALFQMSIGDPVVIEPGIYIPHGQVVIDGRVDIGSGTVLAPWVTIGLTRGTVGPTIGHNTLVGTGAKILGALKVGDHARIGANAVVVDDVPTKTTVVGAPARPVEKR